MPLSEGPVEPEQTQDRPGETSHRGHAEDGRYPRSARLGSLACHDGSAESEAHLVTGPKWARDEASSGRSTPSQDGYSRGETLQCGPNGISPPALPRSLPLRAIIITPHDARWFLVNWRELIEFRDLFLFLILRDLKAVYKQTVLGIGWAVGPPLATMLLFTIVFGRVANLSTDGLPQPLFYMAALAPWSYLNNAVTTAASSLITQANLVSKVYVPRLLIPLTPLVAKLVDFIIALLMLGGLVAWASLKNGVLYISFPRLLLIPPAIALLLITSAGLALLLAALAVKYRDIKFAMPFLLQMLMYAAPVVWPASLLSAHTRALVGLYPMFAVIESLRAALHDSRPVPWDLLASGAVGSFVIFLVGLLVFKKQERDFADVA